MKPVTLGPEAIAELAEASEYAESNWSGRGQRLLDSVERTIEFIRRFPQVGGIWRKTQFRKRIVPSFPYAVFYREFDDYIWIVSVAHQKRRPGYWRKRQPPTP